jgi:hypothetical protein
LQRTDERNHAVCKKRYYRATVLTLKAELKKRCGRTVAIIFRMMVNNGIKIGQKIAIEYSLNLLNKAKDSLRARE